MTNENKTADLPAHIYKAADDARTAYLRDVDCNDQISALSVAVDAAVAALAPPPDDVAQLREEVAYWRRDLEARLWSLTARYRAFRAERSVYSAQMLAGEIRSALASYDDAKAHEWHERCDVCGEFVLPGEPRAADDEISGHARCLVEDQQDAPAEPEPADNLDARAAAARAALNEPEPAEAGQ